MAPFLKYAQRTWCHILLTTLPLSVTTTAGRRMNSLNLQAKQDSGPLATEDAEHRCWVFHYMVKSGGTTVKVLLQRFAARSSTRRSEYATAMWLRGVHGTSSAEQFFTKVDGIIYGGHAEALRPIEDSGNSRWFTIFRHPVSRLVSAFFYCKYMNSKDPLCAQDTIDLDTVDLLSFSEYWGNYGLRQYALGFLSNEEILASPSARECTGCLGWYIVKRHLRSLQQETPNNATGVFSNVSSTDEYSLYAILKPSLEVISSGYTAVGILEDMTTTMRPFDRALDMDHFNWAMEKQKFSAKNQDLKRKSEEHAILHEAWTNPAIIGFISLDLILYEYATRVNAKQLEQYGRDNI